MITAWKTTIQSVSAYINKYSDMCCVEHKSVFFPLQSIIYYNNEAMKVSHENVSKNLGK